MTPQILCQRSPAWADIKMGTSNVTVGECGCLITSLSMIMDYVGCYKNPGELAQWPGLIDGNGMLQWDKIPGLKLIKRDWGYYPNNIQAALKNPLQYAIIEVGNPTKTKTHFMFAFRAKRSLLPPFNIIDWYVGDPFTGKEVLASIYLHSVGPIISSAYLCKA